MTTHIKHLAGTLVAAALLAPPLVAQNRDPRVAQMEAAARTITAADLERDVSFLACDANKGRSTLEPGYDSAAAYIARALKAMGVKPAGDSGGYFQHYTVISARLDTLKVTGAVNHTGGNLDDSPLLYGVHFVVQSFLQPGLHQGDVVWVAHGIRAPALNIDAYVGVDVRGKWILVEGGNPLPRGITREQLGTLGRDYFTAAEEARSRGAIGLLIMPTEGSIAGWNGFRNRVVNGRDLTPSVGRAYAAYPLPRIMLSPDAVSMLFPTGNYSGVEAVTTVLMPDGSRQVKVGSDINRRLRIDLASTTTTYRPYNVVGIIEGIDPAVRDEWISVTSHLDGAVGRGVTPEGDSIYNAADDNASGSAGDLAVARALMAGPRPRRSVLMTWDSGEEIGLWGSRHMAYNASQKIVAHFNIDMIGRTRAPGTSVEAEANLAGPNEVFVSGPAVMSTMMNRVLTHVRDTYRWATLTPKHDDPTVSFFYPRTDAAPFIENGVPVIQFLTGLHADYHRQGDDVGKLDIPKMEGVSRMIYATVWFMADDAEKPRWDKPVPSQLPFVTPRP